MLKIDFVPNDYLQQRESGRTNLMYLFLVGVFILATGLTFLVIKMRQKNVASELAAINLDMAKVSRQIAQLEELRIKSREMMKTMLTTAELLEPVPKSIILASLTNNLPDGVSLLQLKFIQKEPKLSSLKKKKTASQYQAANATVPEPRISREKLLETHITIRGVARSDIEVAGYIAKLGTSILFDDIKLVESKEHKVENLKFREFELKTMLRKNVLLTKEDIAAIKVSHRRMM